MLVEICLPIYNEEKILTNNVLRLLDFLEQNQFDFTWRIILLVNGSTDNSLKLAFDLNRKKPQKILAIEIKQAGKGRALKEYWLQSQADAIICMDIDLAVSLDNFPALINTIIKDNYDLAFGSRLLFNSKTQRSLIREFSSQTYNLLTRLILDHHFSDLQCGFKAIKTDKFKNISTYLLDNYWFFDTELIIFAKHFKYRIKEIPVNWEEARYDRRKSKVNVFKESGVFLLNLFKLKKRLKRLK